MDYKKPFFILCAVCIGLALYLFRGCGKTDKTEELSSMYQAAQSELKHYKTASGLDSSEKLLLYGDIETLKKLNLTGNDEIERLKKLVNKNTISATVLSTNTSGSVAGKVDVKIPEKTVSVVDTGITPEFLARVKALSCKFKLDSACFPEYTLLADTLDKWIRVSGTAKSSGFKLNYNVYNEYEIAQSFKNEGKWYNPKQVPYVTVKNNNPHTVTRSVQSFAVKPPEIGRVTIGLGTTFGYDLFHPGLGWTIGVSVNYTLVTF